ncbi:hypothetical protein P175DRAFT_0516826 [Aspergillus ochraceoroseus IBT 24754]|uniref:Uncharacterized protein n=2 Tax=Aspergillus ochraceoroseus TaxID=138278 RepID=A0A2T5LTZ7_9EURO|nr:uncharacterized protein P175DRAFT_0516826 [Aspergillus ochraceoroseus IBT 24754]KKK22250.1 hypothetical protein AOCH_001986 [Aspergillus ochraceoroseus]PTU19747.1 hypothetical protein P175DRAFT_0516826 [Aspergillus ochraceoroseus IBT 24754]
MSLYLNGVALVIGAGSGIGRECVLGYAGEGVRSIVLADIDYDAALDAAQESETVATNPAFKALPVRVDVTDPKSVDSMVKRTARMFGRIDYCVNGAGCDVVVTGTLNCIQAIVPVMRNQSVGIYKARGRTRETSRGTIINVASHSPFVLTPQMPQNTTTKHAVLGLTKNAALENAPHGIRINAVCPGWVESPTPDCNENASRPHMVETMIPMSRTAKPEEIADVVLFLSSPRSSYVTGAAWLVDGGMALQASTVMNGAPQLETSCTPS